MMAGDSKPVSAGTQRWLRPPVSNRSAFQNGLPSAVAMAIRLQVEVLAVRPRYAQLIEPPPSASLQEEKDTR